MRQADKLGYNEQEGLSKPSTERATKFHLKQVHVVGVQKSGTGRRAGVELY